VAARQERWKNHTRYFHLASLKMGLNKKGFWTSSHCSRHHHHRPSSVFLLLLVVSCFWWKFFATNLEDWRKVDTWWLGFHRKGDVDTCRYPLRLAFLRRRNSKFTTNTVQSILNSIHFQIWFFLVFINCSMSKIFF
jgi:hypothetical protein